jgi:endonuclease/exonuclease/phosphatase (EEP) superfamily protein YafD
MPGTRRSPSQYDWGKQLFDEILLPTSGSRRRATVPRRGKIKHIDIHHMTVHDSANGRANAMCAKIWESREASAHYGIDNDYVAQFVMDNNEAWGNANARANMEGIVIEHANSTLGPLWMIGGKTLESSVRLVAELHITHELGRPTSTGFGMGGTVRTHRSFYSTSCPGPYFERIWSSYIKRIQAEYDRLVRRPSAPSAPTPSKEKFVGDIKLIHWNIADDDTVNGYKAENADRGDEIGRYIRDMKADAFLACEAGNKPLLKDIDRFLENRFSAKDQSIWVKDKSGLLVPRRAYATASKYNFLKRSKYGTAMFAEKHGKEYGVLEIHTDYRKSAKQAKQVYTIFEQFLADSVKLGVPKKNLIVTGDFNWDGTSSDNPFKALAHFKFEEKGNKDQATFLDGRHLDGVLAHEDADVEVKVLSRSDSNGTKLSDHNPLQILVKLS